MAQRIRGLAIPPMVIYNYNTPPYNLAASRTAQVPENLETVFRVLRVKDCEFKDVIRNVLLDQTSAERLLLVEVTCQPFRKLVTNTEMRVSTCQILRLSLTMNLRRTPTVK